MTPASSRILRCREMAGRETSNGSASSPAVSLALLEQLLDDGKAGRIGKRAKDRVQHIISIFC